MEEHVCRYYGCGQFADEWALQIQREAKALAQDEARYLDAGRDEYGFCGGERNIDG